MNKKAFEAYGRLMLLLKQRYSLFSDGAVHRFCNGFNLVGYEIIILPAVTSCYVICNLSLK